MACCSRDECGLRWLVIVIINFVLRPFRITLHLTWTAWDAVLQPIIKVVLVALFWPRGSVAWEFWKVVFCSIWLDKIKEQAAEGNEATLEDLVTGANVGAVACDTGVKAAVKSVFLQQSDISGHINNVDNVKSTAAGATIANSVWCPDQLCDRDGRPLSQAGVEFRSRISEELTMFSIVAVLLATMAFTPLTVSFGSLNMKGKALDGFLACDFLAFSISVLLAGLYTRLATVLRYCATGQYIIWYIYRFEPTFALMHILFMLDIHLAVLAASFAIWGSWESKAGNSNPMEGAAPLPSKTTVVVLYVVVAVAVLYFLYSWGNSLFCRHNGMCGLLDRQATGNNGRYVHILMDHFKDILAVEPFNVYAPAGAADTHLVKSVDICHEWPWPRPCPSSCFLEPGVEVQSPVFGCCKPCDDHTVISIPETFWGDQCRCWENFAGCTGPVPGAYHQRHEHLAATNLVTYDKDRGIHKFGALANVKLVVSYGNEYLGDARHAVLVADGQVQANTACTDGLVEVTVTTAAPMSDLCKRFGVEVEPQLAWDAAEAEVKGRVASVMGRVLGPEPWNVCYAEPSIRPDDSRYGDNPNRVQRHTQFQVILKPDPGNAQELYLGSLAALGIDTSAHDVRFVEDNWESPVLGAWGLGWEVWLDGMEVTQFTYFQQAGGKVLDAPAVEITYGLERILMSLQGVKHFKDIRYSDGVTYGELFLQNEYEMSCYNLDEADVAEQRQRFALCEAEARRMLEKRLPIPAYDMLLKCSHAFNVMDARGAVGVTERADCFATMRALAREVTGLWMARREELGHPLGTVTSSTDEDAPTAAAAAAKAPATPAAAAAASGPQLFVLEIGSEELPPDDVQAGMSQLRERVPALLNKLRLSHAGVEVHGTPRRLAVLVHDLAAAQTPQQSKVRGPPAKAAYDAAGKPTKALEGFCKKAGVSVDAVTREADAKGVEYCFVEISDTGKTAAEVLFVELPALVGSLSFKKSMRWNSFGAAYSRPLRWLLALHGETPLTFSYGGLTSNSSTRVLRNAVEPVLQVPSAADYLPLLQQQRIQLDFESRRKAIWEAAQAAAAEVGGVIPESAAGDLLDEVSNLVESPTVIRGGFDPAFLELPDDVLVMVMRKHQRYFPVFSVDHKLLPAFITVANGPVDTAAVAAGNEAVLRARFEDAAFFYREDLKHRLDDFRPKLKGTLFQKDLGTIFDKNLRVEALTPALASAMNLAAATETAQAAAALCKADLATHTVTEMTALAGTMGRHYAQKQGLPEEVCTAILEAVLPRQAGDVLPSSPAGIVVAVADRLDSLVGLVAAVGAPSATADPYGLRRAAYGMLQALVSNNVSLSLKEAVSLTAAQQPITVSKQQQAAVLDFVGRRLEQLLIDSGISAEAVRAVLAERGDDPALASSTASQLQAALHAGDASPLKPIMTALSRPTRIVRGKSVDSSLAVDAALFEHAEEKALFAAYQTVSQQLGAGGSRQDVEGWLEAVQGLVAPIDAFFDKVFVMCEDEKVRNNRLALLRDVAGVAKGFVDLSMLPGF